MNKIVHSFKVNNSNSLLAFNIILLFLIVTYATLSIFNDTLRLLSYDEVDYITASIQSLSGRWLSTNTLSIIDFIKLGYAKIGGSLPLDISLIPEDQDNFLLRHYHGVIPTYYLTIFTSLNELFSNNLIDNARIYSTVIFFWIFCLLIIYFINKSSSLYSNYKYPLLLAIFFLSPGVIESFSTFNFHIFLGILIIPYCYYISDLLHKYNISSVFIVGFIMGLMILTLETSLVIIFSTIVYFCLFKRSALNMRLFLWLLVGCATSLIIFNPGFLISCDILKAVFMYAYRIIVKSNAEYGSDTVNNQVVNSILQFLPIFLLLIVSLIPFGLELFKKKTIEDFSCITHEAFIGVIYLIFILRFTLSAYYMFPAMLLLFLGSVQNINHYKLFSSYLWKTSIVFSVFILIPLVIYNSTRIGSSVNSYIAQSKKFSDELSLPALKCNLESVESKNILFLSDASNRLNLYSKKNCFKNFILDYDKQTFLIRINRKYVKLTEVLREYDILLFAISNYREYHQQLIDQNTSISLMDRNFYFSYYKLE